jgi:hypothetical protein
MGYVRKHRCMWVASFTKTAKIRDKFLYGGAGYDEIREAYSAASEKTEKKLFLFVSCLVHKIARCTGWRLEKT